MSMFSTFLGKHAKELRLLGSVVGVLSGIGALPRSDRQKIESAVSAIDDAANSIEKSLKKVKDATEIKIDKRAIESAVKAVLPGLVAAAVQEALKEALPAPAETSSDKAEEKAEDTK